jgi:hypothetical protein
MITGLFMGWTDPISKQWFPIKKMTWSGGKYYTVYVEGMRQAMVISEAHRTAVKAGLAKLDRVSVTDGIESSFKTRIPVNRPFTDVAELMRLDLSTDLTQFDPVEYVARSGGYVGGDTADLFPEVTPDRFGFYHFYFEVEPVESMNIGKYVHLVKVGRKLIISERWIGCQDFVLGRAPGYICDLYAQYPRSISIEIARIDPNRRRFGKFLCHATVDRQLHIPFSNTLYQPLVDLLIESKN